MCGICGAIGGNPAEVEPAIRRMMAAMAHRGPDDSGYEQLPLGRQDNRTAAAFGFRRLAIIDPTPAGHQPMVEPATGNCLVFNGEIYNFRDLRVELQREGVIFQGTSDSEVLLQALTRWGEDALGKLHGMYAFAFFEARTERVLLARDPLGIKPLYVASVGQRLVFASEIRALRASGLVSADLDVSGVASMLAYGAIQDPRTIFAAIRSFPAAHSQWVGACEGDGAGPSPPRRFWRYPGPALDEDVGTAAANVRRLLNDSIRRHLIADVPVGVFLSAGIDSTVITALAREHSPGITAFTVGLRPGEGQDEAAVAASTARSLGIEHVVVNVDADALPERWHEWIEHLDSPSIDGFNTFLVSRQLTEQGVVVGLSGLGADEMFGGYASFSRAPRLAGILRALRFVPAHTRGAVVRSLGSIAGRIGVFEKLADLVEGDPSVAAITRGMRRTLSSTRLAALGLDRGVTGLVADYLDPAAEREGDASLDSFNTVARNEAVHYMRDTLLRDTDAVSMRHSLEVRVPFLDLPLYEYVASLRGRIKRAGAGGSKALLRAACADVIPEPVARRPKTGFALPIDQWMRGTMRDACEAAIDRLAAVPFIEAREVRSVWRRFMSDSGSMHWSRPLSLVVLGAAMG